MQQRHTIFISDLHLDIHQPQITQQFLWLIDKLTSMPVDALYILGDLFEVWIGDDDKTALYDQITRALQKAVQQFPVYVLHGNRDFLLGKKFMKTTGCILLPDETVIDVYGQPVLLMHGDTLCTRDIAYLKARKKMRNVFIQKLFLLLPLSVRRKIAANMRNMSMQHTAHTSLEVMDVTQEEVEKKMRAHQVNYLIHGHTHQPQFHEFLLGQSNALRIVLGAWHGDGNMLIWQTSGQKEWVELSTYFNTLI